MSKTEKIKLSIGECLQLEREILDLMTEKDLSFVTKYELSKLKTKNDSILKNFRERQFEVFKNFGKEEKNGSFILKGSEKEEEGTLELKKLIEVVESFDKSFQMKDFENLKSEKPYITIMRLIKI